MAHVTRLPDDYLDGQTLIAAELNYFSGATALIQQELRGLDQWIYHRPSHNLDWSNASIRTARYRRNGTGTIDDDHGDDDPADLYVLDDECEDLYRPTDIIIRSDVTDLIADYDGSTWEEGNDLLPLPVRKVS